MIWNPAHKHFVFFSTLSKCSITCSTNKIQIDLSDYYFMCIIWVYCFNRYLIKTIHRPFLLLMHMKHLTNDMHFHQTLWLLAALWLSFLMTYKRAFLIINPRHNDTHCSCHTYRTDASLSSPCSLSSISRRSILVTKQTPLFPLGNQEVTSQWNSGALLLAHHTVAPQYRLDECVDISYKY